MEISRERSPESSTHSEEQSRDGSAALYMNHGQQTREVAFSGSGKEQPVGDKMGEFKWSFCQQNYFKNGGLKIV